jgi:alpha-beta hydrolase superfamily lysophospholipase
MSRLAIQALLTASLIISSQAAFNSVQAKVVRRDQSAVAQRTQVPVYVWADQSTRPKAMVLAIHGLAMHGTMFDTVGRHLAAQKILVAAPDLRGYGQWFEHDENCKAEYHGSEQDLARVARELRNIYPGIPLFVAGESLGGTVAVRLAAKHPELVDGLILSAPALKHHHRVGPRTFVQFALLAINPARKIDVSNYIQAYFSDETKISQEGLADPLVKKRMSLGELYSSCRFMSSAVDCVEAIPVDMPVLIMQGKKDRMVKASSVKLLEKKLKSGNRTVCWFAERGHILLETKHAHKETLDTVSTWVSENCAMRTAPEPVTFVARHGR